MKSYSSICREDVTQACGRLDRYLGFIARYRRECNLEQRQQCRENAVRWRAARLRHERQEQQLVKREEEVARQAALEAQRLQGESAQKDVQRWKKAFERLKHRQPEARLEEGGEVLEEDVMGPLPADAGSSRPGSVPHSPATDPRQLQSRSKRQSLDSHLECLRKLRRLRDRMTRSERTAEVRRKRFEQLPPDEIELYKGLFSRFSTDPYTCSLDVFGTHHCCVEVGLGGVGLDEQLAVFTLCIEAIEALMLAREATDAQDEEEPLTLPMSPRLPSSPSSKGGVNLLTFATSIVPDVRRMLSSLRRARVEEEFRNRDPESTGLVSVAACIELICSVVGSSIDQAILEKHARGILRGGAMTDEQPLDEDAHRRSSLLEASIFKAKTCNRAPRGEDCPLSLLQARELFACTCQAVLRGQRQQEWRIREAEGLDDETFRAVRPDLRALHELFGQHAGPAERATAASCRRLLREFGLQPRVVRGQPSEEGLTFAEFLDLVLDARSEAEAECRSDLAEAFESFAAALRSVSETPAAAAWAPRPATIPTRDVCNFLSCVGLGPETHEELQALAHAVEDQLRQGMSDAVGSMNFGGVRRVLQRAHEQTARLARRRMIQRAAADGFEESTLAELEQALHRVGTSRCGELNSDDFWRVASMLTVEIPREILEAACEQLGLSGSDTLELDEFWLLMRCAYSQARALMVNTQKAPTIPEECTRHVTS